MNADSKISSSRSFSFGKNWSKFIETHLSEERVLSATAGLAKSLRVEDLSGLTFLDIGSGSGIHSLASYRLRAKKIYSFDLDPECVLTTQRLWFHEGSPKSWTVEQGDILDENFVKKLGQFDIVYSWGVLHHTGDVWNAIRNGSKLVNSNGLMLLALYSLNVQQKPKYWLEIKKIYNKSSPLKKRYMEIKYLLRHNFVPWLIKIPIYFFKTNKESKNRRRGMELMTDVRDWLGGWPMEFVLDEEVEDFIINLGFKLIQVQKGEACTEFLFKKI